MRIVGVTCESEAVFEHVLAHGEDPTSAPLGYGYRMLRPLSTRRSDEEIELRLVVEPFDGPIPADRRRTSRNADPGPQGDEPPRVFQRIAAYAVVTSELGVLATEYSDRTGAAGRWGLPGGGIDPHEDPADAVIREIAEETDQAVELGGLVGVHSGHWIGRSPRGHLEDFHAVRLIYAASCSSPTTPQVLDVGGTTESARWVRLDEWRKVRWTSGWRDLLSQWLPVS